MDLVEQVIRCGDGGKRRQDIMDQATRPVADRGGRIILDQLQKLRLPVFVQREAHGSRAVRTIARLPV